MENMSHRPCNDVGLRCRLPRSRARASHAARRGISLIECTVALVILAISLLGLTQVIVTHERLLESIEAWCQSEPQYYVQRPTYDLDRVVGCPANLSTTSAAGVSGAPPNTPFHVVVLSRSRSLNPESATATVVVDEP
jgi:prepilin-type N-terminal cleavage/methylation domain-containing protein